MPAPVAVPSAPTAAAANPIPVPVPTPAAQLAPQLVALVRTSAESRSMIVRLTPEALGPVELRVDVGRDGLSIRLTGMHEATRETAALEPAPTPGGILQDGGLPDVGLDVASDEPTLTHPGVARRAPRPCATKPFPTPWPGQTRWWGSPPPDVGTGVGTRLVDLLA